MIFLVRACLIVKVRLPVLSWVPEALGNLSLQAGGPQPRGLASQTPLASGHLAPHFSQAQAATALSMPSANALIYETQGQSRVVLSQGSRKGGCLLIKCLSLAASKKSGFLCISFFLPSGFKPPKALFCPLKPEPPWASPPRPAAQSLHDAPAPRSRAPTAPGCSEQADARAGTRRSIWARSRPSALGSRAGRLIAAGKHNRPAAD